MKNGLFINNSSIENIYQHFNECNKSFVKEIQLRVSLQDYIEKIFYNAMRYEYWNNDKLVGLIAVYQNRGIGNPAYITIISVQESFYSKGIGTRMMLFLIQELKIKNFKRLLLEVQKKNIIAINFYIKTGFLIKSEKSESSYLMELNIES